MELLKTIEEGMKPFNCVASIRPGYIRVYNSYCGSIMGGYNRQLDRVCQELGLTWKRVRTLGNGMTSSTDWEDRVTPK